MSTSRVFTALLAVGLAAALPAFAGAQNAAPAAAPTAGQMTSPGAKKGTPHRAISNPIKINTCKPQQNMSMVTGYTPGFYPGGPYWGWPSVYPGFSYYSYPVQGDPSLAIDYVNNTHIVMTDIEFGLVARGEMLAEARDKGTFSPGVEIKHQFGLSPNVFPLRTGMTACVPLKIVFADGTKWTNPNLPALRRSIYQHP